MAIMRICRIVGQNWIIEGGRTWAYCIV